MATTLPPSTAQQIAASLDWETATLDDLWLASDDARIPAGSLFTTVEQLHGGHAQY